MGNTRDSGKSGTSSPLDAWGEDAKYPVSDWQLEVANNNTRLGYWDWVNKKKVENKDG